MNIVKVKVVDSEGNLKGRAYTYKSDLIVKIGDLVLADMAGAEKTLQVVETGIQHSEIEGLDYEIKTIKGFASAESIEVKKESEFDLRVVAESLPVIRINYDEIKEALSSALSKYQKIMVTAETLAGCKATQKELAGVRVKLDNYRKDKKRELSAPITVFENQCKELIALVESVEQPIKEGIAVFDDEKRRVKREKAEYLIKEVVAESDLNEKYAKQLTVLEKYCNLTAKESDVRSDLESRAFALKVEQDREEELIGIIESEIKAQNERINQRLTIADFQRMISAGIKTADILQEVKSRAQKIYNAEHPAQEDVVKVTEKLDAITEPESMGVKEQNDPICYGVYRVSGKLSLLKGVRPYLESLGLSCHVEDQGEL